MQRPWPRADEIVADDAATAEIEWFKNVLSGTRRIRSEMNISPAKAIPLLFAAGDASDRARRSEERRVGKECVSTCSTRWSPSHSKKKIISPKLKTTRSSQT